MEEKDNGAVEGTPYWDSLGKEQFPFLEANKEQMQKGLKGIKFLEDKPFRQTMDSYKGSDDKRPKMWFLVEVRGNKLTFTTSSYTLLEGLKKHSPLKGKSFDLQLIPVDAEYRKAYPKFKGNERYVVTLLTDEVIKQREEAKPAESAPAAPTPTETVD